MLTFSRKNPDAQGMASPDGTSLLLDGPNAQGKVQVIALPTLEEIDSNPAGRRGLASKEIR
jgi:hypothetical protein